MAIYKFENKVPSIDESSFVHEHATVIGDVKIGKSCFVGAGAVLRGDYGTIIIGNRTSVQENCVIHARENDTCEIGDDVQIGHGSVLHNCKVSNFAVIGLGSRICDYAKIGTWSIIGEGATVASNTFIPDESVAVGVPARVIRQVSEEEKNNWNHYKQMYAELCNRYAKGLERVG